MIEGREPWIWTKGDADLHEELDGQHLRSQCFEGSFTEHWYQGRGVYGGLSAAVILHAMQQMEPNRSPRTFTLHCPKPVLNKPTIVKTEIEYRGGKVTHLSGRLLQKGEDDTYTMVAFASASFGEARSFNRNYPAEVAPQAPRPHEVVEVPKESPIMPAFCKHFTYRFCLDALPYTGDKIAALGGWIDLREDYVLSFPYIATLLDAWPPAVFSTLKAPLRAASIDFTYHFLCNEQQLVSLEKPFLYRGKQFSLADGYAEERNWLWDAKGLPVGTARQLYAIG